MSDSELSRRSSSPVNRRGWRLACAVMGVGVIAGCGFAPADASQAVTNESILQADLPGATERSMDYSDGKATRMFDLHGEWNQVSVSMAWLAKDEGWSMESIECVGTGNDVIAVKQVGDDFLLLESGAGERGAGMIISVSNRTQLPTQVTTSRSCPPSLVSAVS